MVANQEAAYTAAAMRTIGSKAKLATPEALNNASDDIVKTLNDVADSATTIPSAAVVNKLDDGISDYTSGMTSSTDRRMAFCVSSCSATDWLASRSFEVVRNTSTPSPSNASINVSSAAR